MKTETVKKIKMEGADWAVPGTSRVTSDYNVLVELFYDLSKKYDEKGSFVTGPLAKAEAKLCYLRDEVSYMNNFGLPNIDVNVATKDILSELAQAEALLYLK